MVGRGMPISDDSAAARQNTARAFGRAHKTILTAVFGNAEGLALSNYLRTVIDQPVRLTFIIRARLLREIDCMRLVAGRYDLSSPPPSRRELAMGAIPAGGVTLTAVDVFHRAVRSGKFARICAGGART